MTYLREFDYDQQAVHFMLSYFHMAQYSLWLQIDIIFSFQNFSVAKTDRKVLTIMIFCVLNLSVLVLLSDLLFYSLISHQPVRLLAGFHLLLVFSIACFIISLVVSFLFSKYRQLSFLVDFQFAILQSFHCFNLTLLVADLLIQEQISSLI